MTIATMLPIVKKKKMETVSSTNADNAVHMQWSTVEPSEQPAACDDTGLEIMVVLSQQSQSHKNRLLVTCKNRYSWSHGRWDLKGV